MELNKFEDGEMSVLAGSKEYQYYQQAYVDQTITEYGYVARMTPIAIQDKATVCIEFVSATNEPISRADA